MFFFLGKTDELLNTHRITTHRHDISCIYILRSLSLHAILVFPASGTIVRVQHLFDWLVITNCKLQL